jgi:pimeloyl-ACP methyl ester carboxylesterase
VTRVEGAWKHRDVAANGARFHIAEVGEGPLIMLLHGFPEFWWAWRHQLPVLAAAGYRVVAMDLRGYGSSDKTPRGYDPMTLAADVAGVIQTIGARAAVVVGQGWGGLVGWATAAAHPVCVDALCTVAAPHPTQLLRPSLTAHRGPIGHLVAMQVPWIPERQIRRGSYVARHLSRWSSDESSFPSTEVVARYTEALAAWPAPHCALEYHRWLLRSRLRADGRAFTRLMRPAIALPVLQIVGADDPATSPLAVRRSARHVDPSHGSHTVVVLESAGHFPHEEQPDAFTAALSTWLEGLAL